MTDSHDVDAFIRSMRRLQMQGRWEDVLSAVWSALAQAPETMALNVEALYLLSRAQPHTRHQLLQTYMALLGCSGLDQLLALLERRHGDDPRRYELFATLGRLFTRLEMPDHAVRAFAGAQRPAVGDDVPAAAIVKQYEDGAACYDDDRAHIGAVEDFATLLGECLEGPRHGLTVVDAACGSGLGAPTWRPWADRLVGVDLSPHMLARAAATGLYDQVVEGDMVAALDGMPDSADLVVCSGATYYLRDIRPFLAAATRCLKPGGQLFFSDYPAAAGSMEVVETIGGTHRYGRSAALMGTLFNQFGLSERVCVVELSFTLPAYHWLVRKSA